MNLTTFEIEMTEWVNFKKSGGPKMAGTYFVASERTKDVGQARWLPRKKEWKWPNSAIAFEATHWSYMQSAPSDIA